MREECVCVCIDSNSHHCAVLWFRWMKDLNHLDCNTIGQLVCEAH